MVENGRKVGLRKVRAIMNNLVESEVKDLERTPHDERNAY